MTEGLLNDFYISEVVNCIRKAIVLSPLSCPEAEREFFRFFESLRRNPELYSLIMFKNVKIVDSDMERGRVVIKDWNGNIIKVNLSY